MKVSAITDVGKMRANNEDVFKVLEGINIFIVCDGMGGHQAGEIAAQIAADDLAEALTNEYRVTEANFFDVMPEIFDKINKKIMALSSENEQYRNMGTTVVLACVINDVLLVANVGDSRCYVLSGDLKQVSKDHSLVAELLKIGSISEEEAENHPDKNIITSALGVDEKFDIFMDKVSLNDVTHILLCSDGLSNMLSAHKITEIINSTSNELCVNRLIEVANDHGGQDNITVICIEI